MATATAVAAVATASSVAVASYSTRRPRPRSVVAPSAALDPQADVLHANARPWSGRAAAASAAGSGGGDPIAIAAAVGMPLCGRRLHRRGRGHCRRLRRGTDCRHGEGVARSVPASRGERSRRRFPLTLAGAAVVIVAAAAVVVPNAPAGRQHHLRSHAARRRSRPPVPGQSLEHVHPMALLHSGDIAALLVLEIAHLAAQSVHLAVAPAQGAAGPHHHKAENEAGGEPLDEAQGVPGRFLLAHSHRQGAQVAGCRARHHVALVADRLASRPRSQEIRALPTAAVIWHRCGIAGHCTARCLREVAQMARDTVAQDVAGVAEW
mmetsp:Transcript_10587/g.24222  ORF Transcript_10587/g.24222 Transcript_10587/m.24222 type:complete len:322 (+) Transcript_10587:237-1202(+)